MAEAKGPLSDPAYQKALATLKRTADVEGLATLLGQQGVEVLVGPATDRLISSIRSGVIGAAADHRKSPVPRRLPDIPASRCPRGWSAACRWASLS